MWLSVERGFSLRKVCKRSGLPKLGHVCYSGVMQTIEISTYLDASPDRIWDELNKPSLMLFVAHPILQFEAVEPEILPERWQERGYEMKLSWYGIVPLGKQVIRISKPAHEGETRQIRDNGYNAYIRRWDHQVFVEPDGKGTRYTDRVEIEAGILTPFVAAFARKFYGHRQTRWRKLVESDFDYGE